MSYVKGLKYLFHRGVLKLFTLQCIFNYLVKIKALVFLIFLSPKQSLMKLTIDEFVILSYSFSLFYINYFVFNIEFITVINYRRFLHYQPSIKYYIFMYV